MKFSLSLRKNPGLYKWRLMATPKYPFTRTLERMAENCHHICTSLQYQDITGNLNHVHHQVLEMTS